MRSAARWIGPCCLVGMLLAGPSLPAAGGAVEVSPQAKVWQAMTLTVDGPASGEAADPNPFMDYRLTVTFAQGEKAVVVPGYYAADGEAGQSGAETGGKWRAHFVPDEPGQWSYTVSFRAGPKVAIDLAGEAGEPVAGVDGASGTLTVAPADPKAPGFLGKGLLRYVGKHHLRFAGSGEYYLKGGADSPENLLGYWEFDGTRSTNKRKTHELIDGLHRYGPHVKHWRPGDPTWRGGKGKGIIGGLNYLAAKGVNSIYFLTYNIDGGDGHDTWMWSGPNERLRFDCSKLDQWEIVFSHADRLGIQLHFVTQESENDRRLGGAGGLNDVRKLYYRQLVARFAHHLAVQWNIGEENNNRNDQRKAFAKYIRDFDPYDHPIVVHTGYGQASKFYNGLLGDACYEGTSIQGDAAAYNRWAVELRRRSAQAGRPWCIYGDEQGPPVKADLSNLHRLRKEALWGNLMGGGAGVEWYFGYQKGFGDLQSEDWAAAEPLWDMTRYALRFFQTNLPFAQMSPANDRVTGKGNMCLSLVGKVYAVYLPAGGETELDLGESTGTYSVRWYNPRAGGPLLAGPVKAVAGPGRKSLGAPPTDADKDWAVLVRAEGGPLFSFGVIADVQAADKDTAGARDYRKAYESLARCVEDLNGRDLSFVVQLGDLTDTPEKGEGETQTPLEKVLPIFNRLKAPRYHVIGNHDVWRVPDRSVVLKMLGIESGHYDFARPGWRFVVLDANDDGKFGKIAAAQRDWLAGRLSAAAQAGERVIVLSHYPLPTARGQDGKASHMIVRMLEDAGCVEAYFAGHHHKGGYAFAGGIHHVTFQGMVEAPDENAYAVVDVHPDRLEIRGVGKVPRRTLKLRLAPVATR